MEKETFPWRCISWGVSFVRCVSCDRFNILKSACSTVFGLEWGSSLSLWFSLLLLWLCRLSVWWIVSILSFSSSVYSRLHSSGNNWKCLFQVVRARRFLNFLSLRDLSPLSTHLHLIFHVTRCISVQRFHILHGETLYTVLYVLLYLNSYMCINIKPLKCTYYCLLMNSAFVL